MKNELDIDRLARMVKAKRAGQGLRETARQIGDISPSTLSRVENGKTPDVETFLRVCDWLGVPAGEFLVTDSSLMQAAEAQGSAGAAEQIAIQLRASKDLDEATAHALAELVRAVSRRQEGGR
jgi:transcriptional regulator with XRE-family HTH domain